jgi:hypothetical protein
MRLIEVVDTDIGIVESDKAMMMVFLGINTMRMVHGDGVEIGRWTDKDGSFRKSDGIDEAPFRIDEAPFGIDEAPSGNESDFRKRCHRVIKTDTPYPTGMPAVLCAFGGGDRLKMTVRQLVEPVTRPRQLKDCFFKAPPPDAGAWNTYMLKNRVRMHVVGSDLCKVKPTFRISRNKSSGCVTIGAAVKMYAILPPPLDKICEGFMAAVCISEINLYVESARHTLSHQVKQATTTPNCI